jgi:hypothetical protein
MKVTAAITLLFAAVAMAAPAAQPAEDCVGSCDYKRAPAPTEAEKRSGGCPGSEQCFNHQCNTYVCNGFSCSYQPNGQSC